MSEPYTLSEGRGHEIADFNPSDGHLHTCCDASACDCIGLLFAVAEDAERALAEQRERVEAALAFTDPENGVSCDGPTVDLLGCYAGTLAARVRAALRGDG
jgi:hypothetical protein